MSVEHVKLRGWIWLLLGLFVGVFAGLGISRIMIKEEPADNSSDIPRRLVTVTIDQSQQEELFAQLQKFADKWRYAIRIAPTHTNSDHFHVGLWRTDIKVIGVYLAASGELQIAFSYTESHRPVPDTYFDEEVNDLENYISEIPNATFTFWTPPAQ
jgi:hypothetical protein